ncbi:hypothetical protein AVEN_24607-1 [Araneus ventricosus]|uniref:Uncharacterized protein n=1 Tax=Araneus ventricosus TaxID=182803 RepID=A0A4Y2IJP0_ARAVE|nr:hypothetical protein AVEN_24607-1 [Araneus ventricosus]
MHVHIANPGCFSGIRFHNLEPWGRPSRPSSPDSSDEARLAARTQHICGIAYGRPPVHVHPSASTWSHEQCHQSPPLYCWVNKLIPGGAWLSLFSVEKPATPYGQKKRLSVPGEWQYGRPPVHVPALRPLPGSCEQCHQSPPLLLGEQAIPEVRGSHFSVWKNPRRRMGQKKRLSVPGVSHDGGSQSQVFVAGLEEVFAQEGLADSQGKVKVHQRGRHQCHSQLGSVFQGLGASTQ